MTLIPCKLQVVTKYLFQKLSGFHEDKRQIDLALLTVSIPGLFESQIHIQNNDGGQKAVKCQLV